VGLKTPISRLRGRFYEFEDTPLMPTFHPAYLLRNPRDKMLVWADAQKVLARLGRPVQ
jgi:uracil-DNA glycosylase family 4